MPPILSIVDGVVYENGVAQVGVTVRITNVTKDTYEEVVTETGGYYICDSITNSPISAESGDTIGVSIPDSTMFTYVTTLPEVQVVNFNSLIGSTFTIGDVLDGRTIIRDVIETISTVEDVIKSLTGRVMDELIQSTDTIVNEATKEFIESAISISDSVIKGSERLVTESIANIDSVVKDSERLVAESINTIDDVIKDSVRELTDSLSLAEIEIRGWTHSGRILDETITSTDEIVKDIIKWFTEGVINVNDVLDGLKGYSMVLIDTLSTTESIIKSGIRTISDVISPNDTIVRGGTKLLNEIISPLDTGFSILKTFVKVLATEVVGIGDSITKSIVRTITDVMSGLSDVIESVLDHNEGPVTFTKELIDAIRTYDADITPTKSFMYVTGTFVKRMASRVKKFIE